MSYWRHILILLGLSLTVLFWGTQVRQAESVRQNGETIYLKLRPVDPRALMMGDYMALGYDDQALPDSSIELAPSGKAVLRLDENRVATFVRISDGQSLGENELLINYARDRRPIYGGARYYFQEGTAKTYEPADYGIFKVGANGRAILIALADENFKILTPGD